MNEKLVQALVATLAALTEVLAVIKTDIKPVSAPAAKASTPAKATPVAAAPVQTTEADLLGEPITPEAPVAEVAAPKAAKPAPTANSPELNALIAQIDPSITGLARAREIARIKREMAKGNAVVAAPAVAAPAKAAAPAKVAAPAKAAKAAKPAAPAVATGITKQALLDMGMKLIKADKDGSKKLTEILTGLGAKNLSTLAPEKYQDLHDQLTVLIGG